MSALADTHWWETLAPYRTDFSGTPAGKALSNLSGCLKIESQVWILDDVYRSLARDRTFFGPASDETHATEAIDHFLLSAIEAGCGPGTFSDALEVSSAISCTHLSTLQRLYREGLLKRAVTLHNQGYVDSSEK